jgi:FixJ family two-component response regulator
VDSVPGIGTTFDVFLPEVPAVAANADSAANVFETSGIETVILVENDANLRRSIARLLRVVGYTVVERSGASREPSIAEEQLRRARVLIVDETLGETSGHSLAEAYRRSRPDLAVLYISGYDPSPSLLRALEHGVSDFLAKPFDAKMLRKRVRQLIDRSLSCDRTTGEA